MLTKAQYRTMVEHAHPAVKSAEVRNGGCPGTAIITVRVDDSTQLAQALKAVQDRLEGTIPLGVQVTLRAEGVQGGVEMGRQLQWD